jgi:hypothetical protein
MHPVAHGLRAESIEHGTQRRRAGAITRDKLGIWFSMSDIHAASGQQEFAAYRWHGIVQIDLHAGQCQLLCGHQAGRPAADHGHPQACRASRVCCLLRHSTARHGREERHFCAIVQGGGGIAHHLIAGHAQRRITQRLLPHVAARSQMVAQRATVATPAGSCSTSDDAPSASRTLAKNFTVTAISTVTR